MEDLKRVVASKLVALRKQAGLTQAELAVRINYSDKAVSKWERGEGMPDLPVLYQLSRMFGVSLEWFVGGEEQAVPAVATSPQKSKNRGIITALSVSLVWLVATMIFVIFGICASSIGMYWLSFVYALPVTFIVLLVFNSIWGNTKLNYLYISCLVWLTLVSIYVTLVILGFTSYIWLIFILAVPAQAIIILWSGLEKPKKIDC